MTEQEKKHFRQYEAYGSYITKDGKKIPFNRGYQPLENNNLWVKNIDYQEWYYQDHTDWDERIKNSAEQKVVYHS